VQVQKGEELGSHQLVIVIDVEAHAVADVLVLRQPALHFDLP